jgi:hypothetical protein
VPQHADLGLIASSLLDNPPVRNHTMYTVVCNGARSTEPRVGRASTHEVGLKTRSDQDSRGRVSNCLR